MHGTSLFFPDVKDKREQRFHCLPAICTCLQTAVEPADEQAVILV